MRPESNIPRATYRLQFHRDFTLRDGNFGKLFPIV